jgi:hypothetical protein
VLPKVNISFLLTSNKSATGTNQQLQRTQDTLYIALKSACLCTDQSKHQFFGRGHLEINYRFLTLWNCLLITGVINIYPRSAISMKHFVTIKNFYGEGLWPHAQPPSWRTIPCRLSATAYSIYSQLPPVPGGLPSIRNLRTRHDVVTWDPPNMALSNISLCNEYRLYSPPATFYLTNICIFTITYEVTDIL